MPECHQSRREWIEYSADNMVLREELAAAHDRERFLREFLQVIVQSPSRGSGEIMRSLATALAELADRIRDEEREATVSALSRSERENGCPICMEAGQEMVRAMCGHAVFRRCLDGMTAARLLRCPLCRAVWTTA